MAKRKNPGNTQPEKTPAEPTQPRTANGRGSVIDNEPTVRRGYEAEQEPERQGDGDPGTEPDDA